MSNERRHVIKRLGPGDREAARNLFALLADVFQEPYGPLSDAYIDALLARSDFWALAASADGQLIGGLTAHTLPMTRDESREIFIFDVGVHVDYRRQGVGRALLSHLRTAGKEAGIGPVFVAADVEDVEALELYRAVGAEESPVAMFTL
jgi:aminoglycoside 3-N-acetyltransferase I